MTIRMRNLLACSVVFSAMVATVGHGQSPADPQLGPRLSPAWKTACQEALKTPLPAEADVQPMPDDSGKTSMAFYYGVDGEPQDFVAARQTAWQERAAVATHPGGYRIFSGTLPLAMIYANGLGTPRDPVLALRMGCEATAYPNNLTSADLDALQAALRSAPNPNAPFDLCSAGSPEEHNESLCGGLAFLKNRKRVLNAVAVLTADWSPEQKSTLAPLESAERKFGLTSTIWEEPALNLPANPNATLDYFLYDKAHAEFDDTFLSSMQDLLAHPADSPRSAQTDAELNRNYRTLMDRLRAPGRAMPPTIVLNPLAERGVERDWIAYRNAWVAVVSARFGPEKAAAWSTKMTSQRSATLAKLSEVLGPPDPAAQPWLSLCSRVRTTALPPDISAEPVKPNYPVCASYKPYYGIGGPVDFAAARTCAIAERNLIHFNRNQNIRFDGPGAEIGEEINGSVVLTMLYANGKGVSRNVELAQRFACESMDDGQIAHPDSPEEKTDANRYSDLLHVIASEKTPNLDMCDFVPALGRMETECDLIAWTLADQRRTAAFEAIRKSFTSAQKAAFDRVLKTLRAYLAAHDHNEIAVSGHMLDSGAWDGEHTEREEAFLANLQQFERGNLPHATAAEYAASDKALNAAYAKALEGAGEEVGTEHHTGDAPTRASIRATERLWIVYRDALADFGTLRYPATTRDGWLSYVTKQRAGDL